MPSLDVAINALRAKRGAAEFDTAVKKIKRGSASVDKSVKGTDKALGGLGRQLKTVATGMLGMAAAYKAVRFFQSSAQEAISFETALANVSTMLDDQTMVYLPGYKDELRDLAVEFGQATDILSKGLYDILSASIKAGKAIDVLRVSAKTAVAGLTSTAVAAKALTMVLNAYGFSANEATRVADVLFATVKRGVITFEELASSMGQVIPIGAAAGLSLEQTAAAIAAMTRSGVESHQAMTALKGIITAFMSPTKEAIEAAKKFDLVLNTNTLQTEGFTGALRRLKGATMEEVAAIFPNVRALLGVAATRKNLSALVKDYEDILGDAGAMEIAYQKNAATTAIQLAKNTEMWKDLKRTLGEEMIPTMRDWLVGSRLIVQDLKDWNHELGLALVSILKFKSLPTKENRDFVQSLIDAEEATKRLVEINKELEISNKQLIEKPDKDDFFGGEGTKQTKEELAAIKKIVKAKKEAGQAVTDLYKELKFEKELIGLTTEERERAIKMVELEKHAKILLGDSSSELMEDYKNELLSLQEARDLQKFYDTIEEGMKGMIRSPIIALLDETKDIEDVLKDQLRNLATSVLEMMYEEVITKPLMDAIKAGAAPALAALSNMITGFLQGISGGIVGDFGSMIGGAIFGALGGGLGGGGSIGAPASAGGSFLGADFSAGKKGLTIKRMAKGDILSGATLFPMENGGIALGGEAGKEALMPLGRDNQGRLGVRAAGTESSKTPIKIINVMDQSAVAEYLSTGDGERIVLNIMRRNANEVSEIAG